jgi:undecaprenyl-diphosphatase
MIISILSGLSVLTFYLHKFEEKALGIVISVMGTGSSVFFLKEIFGTERPISEALYTELTHSFPSGHSALAIALYGFLFLNIYTHDPHHIKTRGLVMIGLLIFLVGVSRLYLGVHYFSDVLFGYIVGGVWLFISYRLTQTKN